MRDRLGVGEGTVESGGEEARGRERGARLEGHHQPLDRIGRLNPQQLLTRHEPTRLPRGRGLRVGISVLI